MEELKFLQFYMFENGKRILNTNYSTQKPDTNLNFVNFFNNYFDATVFSYEKQQNLKHFFSAMELCAYVYRCMDACILVIVTEIFYQ